MALEVRNLFDVSDIRPAFEKNGLSFNDHLNFLINTGDGDAALSRVKAGKRQQVRKSLAAGVEICKATTTEEVKRIYELVTILYTTKVKKPFPKWEFFENFFKAGDKLGIFLCMKYEGKVIAGMMCPIFENRIFYDWYVSGDDKNYRNLYPSVMITYSGIEYAVKNNIALYDFLGAGKPKQEYGVREFKAQFGGDLVNNGRFAVTFNMRKYNFSQWLLKRMGYFK
ncbi:MAG: peptidoglycan bridge formation glycyltransferase FemA/FemB family protein [Sphingobacteriales bacterium]|nr:peptidoglycan bridge formation glycyltransferase FemA/FemB family protein [Sphingobacteriales bacterium]